MQLDHKAIKSDLIIFSSESNQSQVKFSSCNLKTLLRIFKDLDYYIVFVTIITYIQACQEYKNEVSQLCDVLLSQYAAYIKSKGPDVGQVTHQSHLCFHKFLIPHYPKWYPRNFFMLKIIVITNKDNQKVSILRLSISTLGGASLEQKPFSRRHQLPTSFPLANQLNQEFNFVFLINLINIYLTIYHRQNVACMMFWNSGI